MIVRNEFEQNSDEWFEYRKKKITGTRLKGLWSARAYTKDKLQAKLTEHEVEFSKKDTIPMLEELLTTDMRVELLRAAPKKIEFYEMLADHLGIEPDDENVMDRGLRLEQDAADEFSKQTGLELELVGCWESEVDPRIINSPDRAVKPDKPAVKKPVYTAAVEIKCLSRARHLQAICENVVPDEFESQKIQYFVVNPDLEVLYFVFYDPRVICKPFHVIEIHREDLGTKPQEYLEFQLAQLKDLDMWVEKLSF